LPVAGEEDPLKPRTLEAWLWPRRLQALLQPAAMLGQLVDGAKLKEVKEDVVGGFLEPPTGKRLLIIAETDGCFIDGVSAATDCTPGHRTLRIEDYGKTAAVFVDTANGKAVRISPRLDLRGLASAYAPAEPRRYYAQMQANTIMPLEEMFTIFSVALNASLQTIVSRPGVRFACACCGEEIINERTVQQGQSLVCYTCAHGGYYSSLDDCLTPTNGKGPTRSRPRPAKMDSA
jgi:formylmethanofuran dehydrogenase subunit E